MANTQQDFIPGIYNYCDRWCERCNFQKRCSSYQNSADLEKVDMDINSEKFWDAVTNNYKKTESILFEEAAKHGIDTNEILKQNVSMMRNGGLNEYKKAREQPIGELSYEYILYVDQFFKKNPIIQEKGNDLIQGIKSGLRSIKETRKEVRRINDCVEVIFQYLMFIHTKFMRALNGYMFEDDLEENSEYPRDSDGSAKIALITAQRSLDAWKVINQLIPGYEDEILPILGMLQSIIRLGNEAFPKAKDFIRPGFDEAGHKYECSLSHIP